MSWGVCLTCSGRTYRAAAECKKCKARRVGKTEEAKAKQSDYHFRSNYGIDLNTYNKMDAKQGGLCAICGQPETTHGRNGMPKRLAVDHDHITGRVRSLLCDKCNRAVGLMNDSIERLQSAIDYLNAHALEGV